MNIVPMPSWVRHQDGKLVLGGFKTIAAAEQFLLSQSRNPKWLEQFSFRMISPYGDLECVVETTAVVTLNFGIFPLT